MNEKTQNLPPAVDIYRFPDGRVTTKKPEQPEPDESPLPTNAPTVLRDAQGNTIIPDHRSVAVRVPGTGPRLVAELCRQFEINVAARSELSLLKETDRRHKAGIDYIYARTDTHAKAVYFAQFEPVRAAVREGQPIPEPDDIFSLIDIQEDFELRRQAAKQGLDDLVKLALPTINRIRSETVKQLKKVLANKEGDEKARAAKVGLPWNPSPAVAELQSCVQWLEERLRASNPNWSNPVESLLDGCCDIN